MLLSSRGSFVTNGSEPIAEKVPLMARSELTKFKEKFLLRTSGT